MLAVFIFTTASTVAINVSAEVTSNFTVLGQTTINKRSWLIIRCRRNSRETLGHAELCFGKRYRRQRKRTED